MEFLNMQTANHVIENKLNMQMQKDWSFLLERFQSLCVEVRNRNEAEAQKQKKYEAAAVRYIFTSYLQHSYTDVLHRSKKNQLHQTRGIRTNVKGKRQERSSNRS